MKKEYEEDFDKSKSSEFTKPQAKPSRQDFAQQNWEPVYTSSIVVNSYYDFVTC